MASIRQIARLTGYSPATVSRVLNHDQGLAVKQSTRDKILATARRVHYVAPKRPVQVMNLKRCRTVVLLTPQDPGMTSYFTEINRGIRVAAAAAGLPISNWLVFPQPEFNCQTMENYHAVIAVGVFSARLLAQIYQHNQNLVLVDDYRYFDHYDLVRNNYEAAMKQALDQLYQQGRRHILFIGGVINPVTSTGQERAETLEIRTRAYENWMRIHRLTAHTYETRWTERDGYQAMQAILTGKQKVDAVVTASDRLAVGAYQALREQGCQVPDDLAVISFDDSVTASQLTPPLSSIRPHSFEMGRVAVRLVISRLTDHRTVAEQVILPSRLIARGSS